MEPIRNLADMVDYARDAKNHNLVVAAGHDPACIEAAGRAVEEGICHVILIGDRERIDKLSGERDLDLDLFTIHDEKDPATAARRAVQMVRSGSAQILMKGLIRTDEYMRAILDKEKGLLPKGALISHLAVIEVPSYHKLLFCSDQAIVPLPTLEEKAKIMDYAIRAAHKLGVAEPKVALIAATEQISSRMPATVEAAELAKLTGFKAKLDGPLSLDLALSRKAVQAKGLESEVAADADILIWPNIEAGNVFYKAVTKLAKATPAAIVAGAAAPCILTSRADSEESKFLSIVFACLLG